MQFLSGFRDETIHPIKRVVSPLSRFAPVLFHPDFNFSTRYGKEGLVDMNECVSERVSEEERKNGTECDGQMPMNLMN